MTAEDHALFGMMAAALRQVEPAMDTLMDEAVGRRAAKWGIVNECLVDINQALRAYDEYMQHALVDISQALRAYDEYMQHAPVWVTPEP